MLALYSFLTRRSEGLLLSLLKKRLKNGKEDPSRIEERKGKSTKKRPSGTLIWVHGASVGEAQSALILIETLLKASPDATIMITTGTRTSAKFLNHRLPKRCFHQYIPLDHPAWTQEFLDHWKPDAALWMESELWPNMLKAIKERSIPAALINARLSYSSYRTWKLFKSSARKALSTFQTILTQNETATQRFHTLGAHQAITTDNLKFSAKPLSHDADDFKSLVIALNNRPIWLFASTHDGEEDIACRAHQILKATTPDLLTIIIPRHPERGAQIETLAHSHGLNCTRRSSGKALPGPDDDIYLADTLGELGLFYRAAPIACIGRSLSKDGGGGHNPLEAAQLDCAILSGPNIQYQQDIYDEMRASSALMIAENEEQLTQYLHLLLNDAQQRTRLQKNALDFAKRKDHVIDDIMPHLKPLIDTLNNQKAA